MIRFFAYLLCFLATSTAVSQEATDWPLRGLTGLSGTFVTETVTDGGEGGGDMATTSGRFASAKPNYYLWDVQTPDKQLLLINSEGFWQFDQDLEVVIVRDIPPMSQLPLANLWLDEQELDSFRSKVADGEVEGISAFDLNVLSSTTIEMSLVDSLGRETRFTLNIASTKTPDSNEFELVIPQGTDFFDERTDTSITPPGNAR